MNAPTWFSIKEAAKYVGLSETTIRVFTKSGEIPCYRFTSRYQIKKEDLDDWIETKKFEVKEKIKPAKIKSSRILKGVDVSKAVYKKGEKFV